MSGERTIRVLVTAAPAIESRAAEAESLGLGPRFISFNGSENASGRIDVVLSDRLLSTKELRRLLARHGTLEAALVLVGAERGGNGAVAAADAELPGDATPREIALVCRMAGSVAAWKRRHLAVRQRSRRLRDLSLVDPLTGAGNRRAWNSRLAAACRRLNEKERGFCVALFDVDLFKLVNDEQSHAAGDALLKAVATSLAEKFRLGDFVGRPGGDEFGVILDGLPEEHAGHVIERVRGEISDTAWRRANLSHRVAISAGWTAACAGDDARGLLDRADAQLRAAKQEGRDRTRPAEERKDQG